jgi:hypothetical protein
MNIWLKSSTTFFQHATWAWKNDKHQFLPLKLPELNDIVNPSFINLPTTDQRRVIGEAFIMKEILPTEFSRLIQKIWQFFLFQFQKIWFQTEINFQLIQGLSSLSVLLSKDKLKVEITLNVSIQHNMGRIV